MSVTQTATPGGVTVVTQTRIKAGKEDEFARWQKSIGAAVAEFSGFIEQTVMPPNPPAQIDWVILQRFAESRGGDVVAEFQPAARSDRARAPDARGAGRYSYLERRVPWSARRFGWWITPQGASVTRINIIGAGAVVGLYIVCLLAFALYSNWPLARSFETPSSSDRMSLPSWGNSPSMRYARVARIGQAEPQARRVSHEQA